MGFFGKLFIAGVAGFAVKQIGNNFHERARANKRESIPCEFTEKLTEAQFENLAFNAVKKIKKKKINIEVYGPKIYGTVESQSGLTEWDFTIDFNDYGSVTGTYWLWSENDDSLIPKHMAEDMQESIEDILYN